jgi:hypothetical protein
MKKSIMTLVVFFSSMVFVTVSEFSGVQSWQELKQEQQLGAASGIDEQVGESVFESLRPFNGSVGARVPDRRILELETGNSPRADSEGKIEHLILPEGVVRQFVGQLRLLPIDVLLPGRIDEDPSRLDLDTNTTKADEREGASKSTQADFPDIADRKWQQPPAGDQCDGGET